MRFLRLVSLLLGAIALQITAGCVHADGGARSGEAAAPGPALWKVADEDTTIYLFGTIHALPKDVDWYAPHIAQALETSDELVTEVDLSHADIMPDLVAEKAALPEGQNLRDMLDGEQRKAFEHAMISLGLPVQAFDRFEPWYAAMTFSLIPLLNAGYDTEHGVETVLSQHFGPDKSRDHLETAEFQIDLFDSLPMDTQITYLAEVVRTVPDLKHELDAMVRQWLDGNAQGLARLMKAQETDPLIYRRLITDRNAKWAAWVGKRLEKPGTVFIAVGAGHLAGRESLQEQLRKRGIRSARVQ